MNRRHIAVVAFAAATLAACTKPEKQSAGDPIGRYQLLYGEHEYVGQTGTTTISKVILRIDTVTGETSEYTSGQGPSGGLQDFWHHIPENPR